MDSATLQKDISGDVEGWIDDWKDGGSQIDVAARVIQQGEFSCLYWAEITNQLLMDESLPDPACTLETLLDSLYHQLADSLTD